MEIAALQMKVDSSGVVASTADLDRLSVAADRAAASAQKLSSVGSIGKIAQDYARTSRAANDAVAATTKIDRALAGVSKSTQQANSHVLAYQKSLQAATAASNAATGSSQNFAKMTDAERVAYERTAKAAWEKQMATRAAANANTVAANQAWNAAQANTSVATTAVAAANNNQKLAQSTIGVSQGTQQANAHVLAYQRNLQAASGAAAAAARAATVLASAFGAILGVAITMVINLIVGMIVELFKADDAMKTLTVASDNLGKTQSVLGEMFDLATGKVKNNTQAVRDNIVMNMRLMEQQSIMSRREADKALREGGASESGAFGRFWTRLTSGAQTQSQTSAVNAQIAQRDQFAKVAQNLVANVASGYPVERADADLRKYRNAVSERAYYAAINAINQARDSYTAGQSASNMAKVLAGGGLPDQYRKAEKATKTPRGPKTQGERISDFVRQAQDMVEVEKARGQAVGLAARDAAELEQKTALLNKAEQAKIKITPELTAKVDELAKAYADAKVEADVLAAQRASTDGENKRIEQIEDETKLIGLYGDALKYARWEMEAQKQYRDSLPEGEIAVRHDITRERREADQAATLTDRLEKLRRERELSDAAMRAEAGAIGLSGKELLKYNYVQDRVLDALREGNPLRDEEIAKINENADAYARQRHAIERAIEFQNILARGAESLSDGIVDAIANSRSLGDVFASVSRQIVADLIRIAIRQTIVNSLMGALGGLFGGLFGGGGGAAATTAASAGRGISSIGANIPRFATGGVFTNRIISDPTLFKFANGGKFGLMGEEGAEAIMPLTRLPNGKLGVHAQGGGGGRPAINAPIHVQNDYHIQGAVTPSDIIALIRQGSAATQAEVKRQLGAWIQEYDRDGAVAA